MILSFPSLNGPRWENPSVRSEMQQSFFKNACANSIAITLKNGSGSSGSPRSGTAPVSWRASNRRHTPLAAVKLLPYTNAFLTPFIEWRSQPLSVPHNPLQAMTNDHSPKMLESEGAHLPDS